MSLQILAEGQEGRGKTLFMLGMAALGDIAISDYECKLLSYVEPFEGSPDMAGIHPEMRCYHLKPHIADLLGSKPETRVYAVHGRDIGAQETFMKACAMVPEVVGFGVDSGTVLWHEVSKIAWTSRLQKGGAWVGPKNRFDAIEYIAAKSGKHLVITSHLKEEYDKATDRPTGNLVPDIQGRCPYWVHLRLRLTEGKAGKPVGEIMKENSGGLFKLGERLTNATFLGVCERWGGVEKTEGLIEPGELEYRNRQAVEGRYQAAE